MTNYVLDSKAEDYKEKVKSIIDSAEKLENKKIMAGSIAYHQLGDISREWGTSLPNEYDTLEYAVVTHETEKYYIGAWVEGYGFFNVLFPKDTIPLSIFCSSWVVSLSLVNSSACDK